MALEVAGTFGNRHQFARHLGCHTGFMGDDFGFNCMRRVAEIERAKTLLGGLLEVFHQALVARVVGNYHLKIRVRMHQLTLFLQWQDAPVVG